MSCHRWTYSYMDIVRAAPGDESPGRTALHGHPERSPGEGRAQERRPVVDFADLLLQTGATRLPVITHAAS